MSQHARTAKHKKSHPESESRRKERQRAVEDLYRFHIKRNLLYGYGLPNILDQGSDVFERVRDEVKGQFDVPVEVVS